MVPDEMSTKRHFPFLRWIAGRLTGRWARRIYIAIILVLLCLTTTARLRSYMMARRIQAVLHGLAEVHIDQTSEEQLLKTVPYLTRSEHDWKAVGIEQHWYYTNISNESDRLLPRLIGYGPQWLARIAYWMGYRYMNFDASVLIHDGKVSSVRYGLAREWAAPRALSYIVSAKSAHGFWLPYEHHFHVTSQDDESPQYRADGDDKRLSVTFTNDAPPELRRRAFQLNLSCFWSLRGCGETELSCAESKWGCGGGREIAPELWEDARRIQAATRERLFAGKCPDSIVEARMRYLPDVSVLLLEVTGSRRVEINEEGDQTEDWFTDYKLKEVIRERSSGSWKNVRFRRTIPSPMDPMQEMANQIWPQTKLGSQVLFFGSLDFDSCRFIPATPSALAIAHKIAMPPKRAEDQIVTGLQ
jgi:hypothetical protein